ncbi:MAG: ABC transporter ATP-binding protein [Clostridia bacterium]
MSKKITIDHVDKFYGTFKAIDDVSLAIEPGEFFTLLGPSGCGKTTLLRMIAGFNTIEKGVISFGDTAINQVPTYRRNIGMVFQSYAIFPHLSVSENVAYGLKPRKVSKAEAKRRTQEAMELVKISEYADRQPQKLSGGQQQRVALARAIVIKPDLLLMDEPLSNLDAKLRVQMRTSIRELQSELGTTTIYVTHDQEEALAVSDRIAVMNMGVVEQVGKPYDIYAHPVNAFVANFIGVSNFLPGEASQEGISLLGTRPIPLTLRAGRRGPVKASIRPEQIEVVDCQAGLLSGHIKMATFLGDFISYEVALDTGEIMQVNQYIHQNPIMRRAKERVSLRIDKMNVFDEAGKEALL